MAKCPNCGKALSCGCQLKKTSDGRTGCASCISKMQPLSQKQDSNLTSGSNIIRKR